MSRTEFPPITIGNHHIEVPIAVNGMAVRVTGAELAAAAAREGGLGIIAAVGIGFRRPEYDLPIHEADRQALKDEIRKFRQLCPGGVCGFNVMGAATDSDGLVLAGAEAGADILVYGASLPFGLPELTRAYPNLALVPKVSSPRAAIAICERWHRPPYYRYPDAFMYEHPGKAGGHLGATKKQTYDSPLLAAEYVIPRIRAYLDDKGLDIPIIDTGGIWDAEDARRAKKLADAVGIGTRAVMVEECLAKGHQQAYRRATLENIVVITSPVGLPFRVIDLEGGFLQSFRRGEHQSPACPGDCLETCGFKNAKTPEERRNSYCIIDLLDKARNGDELGLYTAGINAFRAREQPEGITIGDVFDELTNP